MADGRAAARDALVARTGRIGLAITVIAGAATGGITGALARAAAADANPPAPAVAPTSGPGTATAPRPRRTVYVRVPSAGGDTRLAPDAGSAAAPRAVRARQAPPAARPVPPPARTQQAPVTTSDGS